MATAASAKADLAWRDANAAPENEAGALEGDLRVPDGGGQEFHMPPCDAEPNQDF